MSIKPNYSSLFYFNPLPSWVYDLETFQVLDVNEAAIAHYGYAKEEFLRLTIKDLRPKGEIPKLAAAHTDIDLREGNIFFGVLTLQKKNGELIRMKINGHKVDYLDKPSMLVVCQDVTQEEEQVRLLKETEVRLKAASTIANLGYWRLELDAKTLSWTDEVYNIWGREKDTFDVNFQNFFQTIHPDDRDAFLKEQDAAFAGKKELNFVHRIILPDGSQKWVHELGRLVKDERGKTTAFEGTVQDITEPKAAEEALRESEDRFRTIFEIASLGIVQVNPTNGQIMLVNSFYESITGYTTEELLQMSFVELTHPDDREKDWEVFSKAMRGEAEYRNEKRYIKKDGSMVWVRLHVAFVRDEQGQPYRTVAICEDITAQKDEEHRLKLLESVITNTKDSILITEAEPQDEPGPRILFVNEAFTNMTGYTAEEVIGKSPRILQGPKSDQAELAGLGKALRNWESKELTTINYKKNGEEFWVNFSVNPVANEKGWYTHWIAVERDVTEQKQKEIEKELWGKISLDFAFENDLFTSTNKLCKTISEFGSFDFVELWLPNLENTQILRMAKHAASANADLFYRESHSICSSPITEGLYGKVWQTQSTHLWRDISQREDFIRKNAAAKAGIQTALGLPLLSNESVVGVLVVGSHQEEKHLKGYVAVFKELEHFIGSEINRKRLENDLNHLYEAIPDLLCLADFQGRFLKINKAGCELLGYAEAEILYHSFDEFVHPEDQDITTREVRKLAEGESTFHFENRYITKDGEIVWLSWTCNSALEEGLIYATAKNITEEKKLRELNRMSSKLARIGSWEIDVPGNKLFWSDMVYELHETDPQDFHPDLQRAINLYRDDFRAQVAECVNNSIETGAPFDFEAVLVTLKNKERWVRAIGHAEMVDGKCLRIYGSFQDIHERKEAEIRLQSLADNLPGVVFQYFLYPDGTDALKYVTKGAETVWGFSQEEVLQNNELIWNQIKAGGDFDELQHSIMQSIQSNAKWTASWKYVLPSGEIKTHLGYGSPYFLPDGTVSFNSVILDITQEAKNEALLAQATEMAKIGGWELDLFNGENDLMYWSPMTREIWEVAEDYNPSLTGGFEFYAQESRTRIQLAVNNLIETGKEFDEELLLLTAKGNEKWIRCIGKSEWVNGKCVSIYGSFQDIHHHKVSEIQLAQKSAYLSSLAEVIAVFLKSESWAECLDKNFQIIGECVGVDRVYYFERHIDPTSKGNLFSQKHEWNSGSAPAQINNPDLQNIPEEAIPELLTPLSEGEMFHAIVSELPETYVKFMLQGQEIKSLITLPIFVGQEVYGFIGFDDCKNERKWSEDEVFFLRSITSNLSAAIQRLSNQMALQEAFEEKNNILESIGDAFFTVDKNWIVTYWNKEAENLIGRKREDLIGDNLWELFADAVDTDFYRQYHQAMESGESVNFEEYDLAVEKWFEVSAYPSNEGLSIYFKDVTLRKETDLRLIQANERFEKVTKATNDAIWDWDILDNTLYWGDGFKSLFGHEIDKTTPTLASWIGHIHPEDKDWVIRSKNDSLNDQDGHNWTAEYRYQKSDGTYADVVDRGVIIRNKEDKPIRMVGAMTDISERKQFEQQLLTLNASLKKHALELEMTNEELEQFAYIASHDLQEPLRMVSSFMEQLKRKYENQLDEKALQYIHFATDGAKRMKKIILDLLEYSRAGKFTEASETVDLNELVENYQILRRKIIKEKAVEIACSELPEIESYKAPLTQTLHCLLDNAIHYSKEGETPKVKVSVTNQHDHWEIEIADNGIGIDPQFHEKIFIIFQRLHNKGHYEGTGIGLSIVKKHVESWGGKIGLESTPGEGSRFYFTIPKITIPIKYRKP